jgi:hypothetical protein
MKKIFILTLICMPLIASAQTITQNDLPTAGTSFITANDTNFVSAMTAGGTGQTWDYSMLDFNSADTSIFQSSAGTPHQGSFPDANLVNYFPVDDSYNYYQNSSTGLYIEGFGMMTDVLDYNPHLLVIPVPFSLNDTRNATAQIEFIDATTSPAFKIVLITNSDFLADATGTLTTPVSTYPNVLRIKQTDLNTSEFYMETSPGNFQLLSSGQNQTTRYNFVTSGLPANYLLGINADSLGTTSISASFLFSSTVDINENQPNVEVIAYPNPASSSVQFKNAEKSAIINIYDSNGKKVSFINDQNENILDTQSFKNGIYHYEIISNGKRLTGKFVVQK